MAAGDDEDLGELMVLTAISAVVVSLALLRFCGLG
tara:strand:+ start:398 stop:502 length:105 start_codon:yes stop_codon:yes gene_type:complete